MKKINWTALITYMFIAVISTAIGWWMINVIYFMYLLLKAWINLK